MSDFFNNLFGDDSSNESTAYLESLRSDDQRSAESEAAIRRSLDLLKKLAAPDEAKVAAQELLQNFVKTTWFVKVDQENEMDPKRVRRNSYTPTINTAGGAAKIDVSKLEHKSREKHVSSAPVGKQERKELELSAAEEDSWLVLPIYAEAQHNTVAIEGRTLVRTVARELDGYMIHYPNQRPTILTEEFFSDLRMFADGFDLDEILIYPKEGQAQALLNARWWVVCENNKPQIGYCVQDASVIQAYTYFDSLLMNSHKIRSMSGRELFEFFLESDSVDGIVVNDIMKIKAGGKEIFLYALSPAFAYHVLQGRDIRPGVEPLPARSKKEIEMWLKMRKFPADGRRFVDAPYEDYTLVRAIVESASEWEMQESLSGNSLREAPTWSPVFELKGDARTEEEFGHEPSQILCPGFLAYELNATAFSNKDAKSYWRPGKFLVFGRLLDTFDQNESKLRLAIAIELQKLIPAGHDHIPRSAIVTVFGASILRRYPHAATRAWIEETIVQAERYTKSWVMGI